MLILRTTEVQPNWCFWLTHFASKLVSCYYLQELHEDIYPIVEVGDPTGQVMGSCSSYDSRKRVTPQIRSVDLIPQMTLSEAVER